MKYINPQGLDDAFFRVVVNDPYTKGEADFSATQLANPARAIILLERHKDVIEIDVASKVAATLGQGAHTLLERAKRPGIDFIETRYYYRLRLDQHDYVIGAQIDLYETDTACLKDWKTTKAFAFSKKAGAGKKPEWIAQMSIQAFLMEEHGWEVKETKILSLLKDWDENKAKIDPSYPQLEFMSVSLPRWSKEQTLGYIITKVTAILAGRENLPRCTPAETWGGRRCAKWCDVAQVCDQYKQAKQTGIIGDSNGLL